MDWLVIVNPDGRVRRVTQFVPGYDYVPDGWSVVSVRPDRGRNRMSFLHTGWMKLPVYDPDENTEVFVTVDPAKKHPNFYIPNPMNRRKGERRNLADQLGVIQTMSGEYLYVFDLPGGLMCIDRRKSDRRKAGK